MNQFLSSLPRIVIAIAAIVGGLIFIVLANPPKTVCDAQLDIFRESQKTFLFGVSEKGRQRPPLIKALIDLCQRDNSSGGCFELFERAKKLSIDLSNVPAECSEVAASEQVISESLKKIVKLMVQLAWAERIKSKYGERQGWFDASDVALFCSLRSRMIQLQGNGAFTEWREAVLRGLPSVDNMEREQVWQSSLFSVQCDAFR